MATTVRDNPDQNRHELHVCGVLAGSSWLDLVAPADRARFDLPEGA